MATITATSGNLSAVQTAVNSAAAGDTVIIPSGTWTWTGGTGPGLSIDRGFNIRLIGAGVGGADAGTDAQRMALRPKIRGDAATAKFFDWVMYDVASPKVTAEMGWLDFEREGYLFDITGATTITNPSPGVYAGGFRIHHCRFAFPWHDASGGDAGVAGGGSMYEMRGWLNGVIDHNEIFNNLQRYSGRLGGFNTQEPNGTTSDGGFGDYAFSTVPLGGRQQLAGGLIGICYEDNIIHHGSKGFVDLGSGATYGGGIATIRHNTRWGTQGAHGTRETGNRQNGLRLAEVYNDHYCRCTNAHQTNIDTNPCEIRCGQAVVYNNFITVEHGGTLGASSLNCFMASVVAFCDSYNQTGVGWNHGPDGLCPWDLNQKGTYNDTPRGFVHTPYASYNPATFTSGTIVTGFDTVVNGRDSEDRFGDVYGLVHGGTFSGNTITGCTVDWTSNAQTGSTIPANYFYGFAIRNPVAARGTLGWFTVITGNTAGNASNVLNITVKNCNVGAGSGFAMTYRSAGMELRRVLKYYGAGGQGSLPIRIVKSSNAAVPAALAGGVEIHWQDYVSGGAWGWGNMRRVGTNASTAFAPDNFPNRNNGVFSEYAMSVTDVHYYNGGSATNIIPGNLSQPSLEFKPLFDSGYVWNPAIPAATSPSSGNQATRVGADWGLAWTDPLTGTVVQSTIGPNSPALDGSTANTVTPEFASFYKAGVGGLVYPHPLVVAPAAPADTLPDITTAAGNVYVAGVAEDFTVSATGSPTPVFSIFSTPALPTGVTLVLSSPANGSAIIRAGTGTSPGTTTVHLRATNSVGFDSQDFTITITATATVRLDSPPDGAVYNQPVNSANPVNLSATVTSANVVSKVEFIRGTTPNEVIIATVTTASSGGTYDYAWTGMADGTYVLKAKGYDTAGNFSSSTVSITVQTPAAAPLDPPTIVVTG